jgi:tRNA (guanine-N7-)-methyltransferase
MASCADDSGSNSADMSGEVPSDAPRRRMIYGRRRGRKLRPAQADRMAVKLPALRFAVPESGPLDPRALFPAGIAGVSLEIGFGAGEHLAAQATAHPTTGFIGVEIFETGVAKLLSAIEAATLDNVRILIDDARLLLAALPDESLDRVFILFPDPWPKLRHRKRRIISKDTLAALARAMRDGAELRLATDDPDYLRAMLGDATEQPAFEWLARRSADWRTRPADWPPTRYEEKALRAGRIPAFLRFLRRPRRRP